MGKITYSENILVDQNDAISAYLDALLTDACESNSKLEYSNDSAQEKCVYSLQNIESDTVAPPQIDRLEKYGDKKLENETISIANIESPQNTSNDALLPQWVQSNFQALSFTVADVVLCAPLSELNGILKVDGKITTLPGQAPWCIGVLRNSNQNVSVIDLTILLKRDVSESSQSPLANRVGVKHPSIKKGELKYILLTGSGKWGLACNTVDNVMRIEKDHIQWQSHANKKIIMGTLAEKKIFLLNIDELLTRLDNSHLRS